MNETDLVEQEIPQKKIEIWDNSKRAKLLMVIFLGMTGLIAIGVISGYLELELLERINSGGNFDEDEASASDLRQGVLGILQTVIYIVSIVVFLNWFRRAYGNLHRLGLNLKHKESMAVWFWFIPILVLFRPVQIMTEIWNKTQESIKNLDTRYLIKSGSLIIGLWWTLFIISNFIGNYVLRTAFKQDTIEQMIEGSRAVLISDIMQIPEALLVVLIVYKLSKMETILTQKVKESGGVVVHK